MAWQTWGLGVVSDEVDVDELAVLLLLLLLLFLKMTTPRGPKP